MMIAKLLGRCIEAKAEIKVLIVPSIRAYASLVASYDC